MPHLRQSVRIARRVTLAERERRALGDAADRLAIAVILVDGTGAVAYRNRAAEALLAERDGLALARGGLRAASMSDQAALGRALSRALEDGIGADLTLARPSGRRPLSVAVCPLRRGGVVESPFVGDGGFAAALFVHDPERAAATDEDLVRRIFGLTPSEARVAVRLAGGLSPKEVAALLGTSTHTARNHLRQVYRKTGVDGQAGLVRVLMAAHPRIVQGDAGGVAVAPARGEQGA
jgi:DNA-binding CsgD family transcriptional regulator